MRGPVIHEDEFHSLRPLGVSFRPEILSAIRAFEIAPILVPSRSGWIFKVVLQQRMPMIRYPTGASEKEDRGLSQRPRGTRCQLLGRSQPGKPFMIGFSPHPEAVDAFLGTKSRSPAVVADQTEPSTADRTAPC